MMAPPLAGARVRFLGCGKYLLSSASLITIKPIIGYGRFAPWRKRTPGIPVNSPLPQLAQNALGVSNTEQQEKD
jgi:hypothetical protein